MRRPPLLLTVAALLAGGLTSCRYAFVPAVPRPIEVTLTPRVTGASLERSGASLVVKAQVTGRFEPAYLKVQWFDGSRPLGEDSVYLDATQPTTSFTLDAPDKGAYRAILSLGGVVLRQVELYEVQP
ncbi:hypothetical protein [Deinococcus sp.]|uniref:hypothetical protein n=1 Tax=Deinococcus sp. TaxID=47478 RepID=UPI002869E2D1|nr:hypothetical protein [Deinococcus sp.]